MLLPQKVVIEDISGDLRQHSIECHYKPNQHRRSLKTHALNFQSQLQNSEPSLRHDPKEIKRERFQREQTKKHEERKSSQNH